jgi:hypothetical protein
MQCCLFSWVWHRRLQLTTLCRESKIRKKPPSVDNRNALATFRRKYEVCGCCGRIAPGMENCKVGRI